MPTRLDVEQGGIAVSADPAVTMSTVLGSCVACCLFDPDTGIGGMNHFLLPAPGRSGAGDGALYGEHAMAGLLADMLRAGASRGALRAHLYGGADLYADMQPFGSANVQVAHDFLAQAGIAIARADTGGGVARRVDFRPALGQVRCRVIRTT